MMYYWQFTQPRSKRLCDGSWDPLRDQEGMLCSKELSCWCWENVALCVWAGISSDGGRSGLCKEQISNAWCRERGGQKGEKNFYVKILLVLKHEKFSYSNFIYWKIKYELYFIGAMLITRTTHYWSLVRHPAHLLHQLKWDACGLHGWPWLRKIPWRRKWQPTPVFLPGESHGQRSPSGYSPWGCRVRQDWSDSACMHGTTGVVIYCGLGYKMILIIWSKTRQLLIFYILTTI